MTKKMGSLNSLLPTIVFCDGTPREHSLAKFKSFYFKCFFSLLEENMKIESTNVFYLQWLSHTDPLFNYPLFWQSFLSST